MRIKEQPQLGFPCGWRKKKQTKKLDYLFIVWNPSASKWFTLYHP